LDHPLCARVLPLADSFVNCETIIAVDGQSFDT
jgi:hypothetical protein